MRSRGSKNHCAAFPVAPAPHSRAGRFGPGSKQPAGRQEEMLKTPSSALVLMCSFWAGARGFGEPSSCFTQTCQISGSSRQHGPMSSMAPRAGVALL